MSKACGHDPENVRLEGRNWRCRECKNEWLREWYVKLRAEVMSHYGSACTCCGETWPPFLQFDHIDGSGGAERKSYKHWSGNRQPIKIRQAGYPDTFQVLCANCNTTKGNGRDCPPGHDQHARDHGKACACESYSPVPARSA